MKIGNIEITGRGWPWQYVEPHWSTQLDKTVGQRFGWNPFDVKGMGRFGGGWAFKFGVTISRSMADWVIDLGIGSVRITKKKPK
jgi:hypothetical protein